MCNDHPFAYNCIRVPFFPILDNRERHENSKLSESVITGRKRVEKLATKTDYYFESKFSSFVSFVGSKNFYFFTFFTFTVLKSCSNVVSTFNNVPSPLDFDRTILIYLFEPPFCPTPIRPIVLTNFRSTVDAVGGILARQESSHSSANSNYSGEA